MKKLFLFFMVLVASITASAQDVIVKKDGSTVLCKILEVNGSEIIYKKWSDQNGANFIMDRSLISNINYQDGRQEKINEVTSNVYAPGNQQTGESLYNDNALLALDNARMTNYPKKIKTLKIVGWTVGGTIFAVGFPMMITGGIMLSIGKANEHISLSLCFTGLALSASGIATTTGCLIKANQLLKKHRQLAVAPIIQHDFDFKDGSRFSAGIDMIRDNFYKKTTFGLGLQYNF